MTKTQTRNALNRKGYLEFYKEVSYKYPEAEITLKQAGGKLRVRSILGFLSSHAKCNHLLLDAGCGGGIISIHYCQKGGKAVAIDIGPGFVEYAKKQAENRGLNDKVKFLVGDICDLCFKEQIFDVIVCAEVLEHLLEPDKAIREFERLLKPDGILIITVPNPLAISLSLRGMKAVPKTFLSIAFKRLFRNRMDAIEFSATVSKKYGIKPTVYKHTAFASFELKSMLPASFEILKGASIVYPFLFRVIQNEQTYFELERLVQNIPFLNMTGRYSLLVAKRRNV